MTAAEGGTQIFNFFGSYFYLFGRGDTLHPLLATFILFCRGRPPAPPFLVIILVFFAGGDPLHPPFVPPVSISYDASWRII